MPNRSIFRRKAYIIKRGLQFRYIGLVFALALLASIVTGYTVFATMWSYFVERLANVYPQGRLMYVLSETNVALLRNLLLISPLIFILGLLFSHKIAGPIYRIEKTIDEISKGNLTLKIKLRQGDEFWDLADIINIMTDSFNKTIASGKDSIIKIQQDLEELKKITASQPYDQAKAEASLKAIASNANELMASCNKWTTA